MDNIYIFESKVVLNYFRMLIAMLPIGKTRAPLASVKAMCAMSR